MMFKIYAILAIVSIIAAVGTGATVYVSRLQSQVATLQVNNAKLETAVKTQQETIKRAQADSQRFQQLNTELQVDLNTANAGLDKLRQTLANHDLTKLVLAKPGLIEMRINDATKELFRQLQTDTSNTIVDEPATAE